MDISPELSEDLKKLSTNPGVYLFENKSGQPIYIGKAKQLRTRVRSYFQKSALHSPYISIMAKNVHAVKTIETSTEVEALLLEANLIKKHSPRYNIKLKDDKSYPYFKLSTNEMYPRLFLVRERFERGAEYFGPYPSASEARQTLRFIQRHFMLRTSKMKLDGSKTYRPCINFQLGRCLAPCRGTVATASYAAVVEQVRMFLSGNEQELFNSLTKEMLLHAQNEAFEQAAQLRNTIALIKRTMERQKIVSAKEIIDRDVHAIVRQGRLAIVYFLFIRKGRMTGSDYRLIENSEHLSSEAILSHTLRRLYANPKILMPKEILVSESLIDQDILTEALQNVRKCKVKIITPQRGDKRQLIELAHSNGKKVLAEQTSRSQNSADLLKEAQKQLHLRHLPTHIEAFDISHISGNHTVAAMVVWQDGQPAKNLYRKYKLNSTGSPDDYSSMAEVIHRRYSKLDAAELPQLILIDGGKGQVNVAASTLADLGITQTKLDVIGFAKGRSAKGKPLGKYDREYVVKANLSSEIRLKRHSSSLYLLQNIRDEVHRFAITYHRRLRSKAQTHSLLEDIPGLGKVGVKRLIDKFKSVRSIQQATAKELATVKGISESSALRIKQHLDQHLL